MKEPGPPGRFLSGATDDKFAIAVKTEKAP
jgi:hypothetical protein